MCCVYSREMQEMQVDELLVMMIMIMIMIMISMMMMMMMMRTTTTTTTTTTTLMQTTNLPPNTSITCATAWNSRQFDFQVLGLKQNPSPNLAYRFARNALTTRFHLVSFVSLADMLPNFLWWPELVFYSIPGSLLENIPNCLSFSFAHIFWHVQYQCSLHKSDSLHSEKSPHEENQNVA